MKEGSHMFKTNASREFQPETVNIEELAPPRTPVAENQRNHRLFIHCGEMPPLYCEDNGRPCMDPVMLFKMLLIGYLYGIRLERRLIEEIRLNIAYRWFVGLSLTDPVPHHSIFSQNRRRRFQQSEIYQEIFDEIVFQAIQHGFIEEKQLFTNSTFLKANASKYKFKKQKVTLPPRITWNSWKKPLMKRLSERGKQLYKRRSQTIERSFADARELHSLLYARYRGLAKVREQCLLIAVAQNIKKMPCSSQREEKALGSTSFTIFNFLYLFNSLKHATPGTFHKKSARGLSSISSPRVRFPWALFLCMIDATQTLFPSFITLARRE
jgi:transposase